MKLNLDKLKSNQIPIGKNGLVTDNTRVPVKEKIQPIPLSLEQQQNFKLYGSLNKPEVKQTYLSQGRKLTPAEQQASNKKLAEQGKLQAYQKQQEQDAKNLEKTVEVAPYVIPGIGQAMWAGKAVDLATNKISDGKYKSWANMVDQKTNSGELIGDLTNPGYYAGALAKVASPLVKEGIKNVGEYLTIRTPLKDAWKLNPYAFKPNPEAYYRGVGKEGIDDIFESGIIKSKKQHAYPEPYFSKGVIGDKYAKGYFAELTGEPMKGVGSFPEGSLIQTPVNIVDINNQNLKLYQKDWLRGYKEIPKPSYVSPTKDYALMDKLVEDPNFKSEINWGNWNKEIPSNKPLMDEYLQIEKTTKQNGTWMKNPDGSQFTGTPEQFVQQNSNNFKKAYPNGFEDVYRGVNRHDSKFLNNKGMFTADKKLAGESYTPSNKKNNILSYNSKSSEGGVHNLYRKNSDNFIEMDARGSTWDHVDLTKSRLSNIELNKNIELLLEQVAKTKNNISKRMSSDSNTSGDYILEGLLTKLKRLSTELDYNKKSLLNLDNLNKNSDMFLKMRNNLGDETTTRNMAKYMEDAKLDYIKLKSIDDAGIGDVTIVNHKSNNYLKSMRGNNGMFDMSNPNIYKGLIPAVGLYGLTQSKKQGGVIKTEEGGLLERKSVPFVTSKPIQPEFPYNGQSMYKGGYNLKRALELYKPDNTGHLPSVDSETGEWLKDKDYPTSWKELLQTTLNLNLNKQVGFPILNTNGRLQYINKNNK